MPTKLVAKVSIAISTPMMYCEPAWWRLADHGLQTGDLVWSNDHTEGGHFAAWEKPKLFIKDMENFVKDVWPKAKGA